MKLVPNVVVRKFSRQILVVSKNSPSLMFYGGLVGAVGATVLACRATLHLDSVVTIAQRDLENIEGLDNHSLEDNQKDKAYVYARTGLQVAKLYAPAIAVGSLSVAALTGSHVTLTRRNAGLTAAYAMLDRKFRDYQARVKDELGEDEEYKLRYPVEDANGNKKSKPSVPSVKVVDGHSVYARFFDECSGSWVRTPEYNMAFLKAQQNYANDLLRSRGHVFLNEIYDSLGIDRSKAGAVVGWALGPKGDNYIDFGIFDANSDRARAFVNGSEAAILLDFNVDGVIYDLI